MRLLISGSWVRNSILGCGKPNNTIIIHLLCITVTIFAYLTFILFKIRLHIYDITIDILHAVKRRDL